MRGDAERQRLMRFGITPDQLVPAGHPIRRIKAIVEPALTALSPTFARMYAAGGRPSIPPERLLKASLLIALDSVRSEWWPQAALHRLGPRSVLGGTDRGDL